MSIPINGESWRMRSSFTYLINKGIFTELVIGLSNPLEKKEVRSDYIQQKISNDGYIFISSGSIPSKVP